MQIITSPDELMALRATWDGSVGFVPTMGALHQGHLSLIQASKAQNDRTIVSVFVNPTQFSAGEDLERYPRKKEADISVCQKAGVDCLFMPEVEGIYPYDDEIQVKAPAKAGFILEGGIRPGHFDGALRVILKLLNLTRPTRAYFGQKDAQQLLLVQQMARDLFLPYEIIPCPTKRDSDGLALSSRNAYLSPADRQEALKLSRALQEAMRAIMQGDLESAKVKESALKILEGIKLDYLEITDRALRPIQRITKGDTLILIAGRIGGVRLIDNLWI